MKRPSLALCIVTIALGIAMAAMPATAHDDDLGGDPAGASLEGTWRLVSPRLDPGEVEYKVIAGGRFTWYVVANWRMVRGAEGRVAQDGETYREWIDSVISDEYRWMVGANARFRAELTGDRWRHRGIVERGGHRAEVDEIWERVR